MQHQYRLPFDAAQIFDLQHSGHRSSIAIATKQDGVWNNGIPKFHHYARDAVITMADLSHETGCNAYVGQSGYTPKHRRSALNVEALTALWVDLDYYKTEHRDLSPAELLEVIRADVRWLPAPTALTDSGRGCYLHWILNQPLNADQLPTWQKAMHALTAVLRPYGADSACADPSRVLRIVGSLHEATGHTVQAWDTGSTYHWFKLRDALNQNYWQPREAEARANPETHRGEITHIRNGYTRTHRALQDIRLLAQLREPVIDYRHRMLMGAAMLSGLFCPTTEAMLNQLQTITPFFEFDHRYQQRYETREQLEARFKTIIGRADRHRAGEVIESGPYEGRTVAYTPSKAYMINLCEISRAEQETMGYLFEPAERKRRARRKAGTPDRVQQLAAARCRERERRAQQLSGNATQAQKLKAQGFSQAEICRQLGVSKSTVKRYLRGGGHHCTGHLLGKKINPLQLGPEQHGFKSVQH